MLPSELLAVWKRKGMIWPRYSRFFEDDLTVANGLIEAYKNHLGQKKSVLKDFADELEDRGFEYRFVRGLTFLLDRRSTFKCDNRAEPLTLRRKIFETTGKLGIPTTQEQRRSVTENVAAELKITPKEVDDFLYADLDSELLLEKFDPPSTLDLLKQYNLSLTQTLLFDSTELRFTTSENWQRIFHTIKRLGLIYEIDRDYGLSVKVDGPVNLFKLTRKYGTAIAKLLPIILSNTQWTVEAKVLWKYTNEICNFKLESWKHNYLLKPPLTPDAQYDSSVEQTFATNFESLKTGWTMKREPEPVSAGKQIIIPDFSFEKDGVKVYMEIVGFWTPEYLQHKVEKLGKADAKMLIAVDENLACQKVTDLGKQPHLQVIFYKDRISLAPVLHFLDEAVKGTHTTQVETLRNLPIIFTEPVINYGEFAERVGSSIEAVKTALTEKAPSDYAILPNSLVRKDKLDQIRKKLEQHIEQSGRLALSFAVEIVEAEGLEDATSVLETIGFKITWHGINAEKAEIIKASAKPQ